MGRLFHLHPLFYLLALSLAHGICNVYAATTSADELSELRASEVKLDEALRAFLNEAQYRFPRDSSTPHIARESSWAGPMDTGWWTTEKDAHGHTSEFESALAHVRLANRSAGLERSGGRVLVRLEQASREIPEKSPTVVEQPGLIILRDGPWSTDPAIHLIGLVGLVPESHVLVFVAARGSEIPLRSWSGGGSNRTAFEGEVKDLSPVWRLEVLRELRDEQQCVLFGYMQGDADGEAWHGVMYSPNCKLAAWTDLDERFLEAKLGSAQLFAAGSLTLSLLELFALLEQLRHSSSMSVVSWVSVWTVTLLAAQDTFMSFVCFSGGLLFKPAFRGFALAAFLRFVLFSIFLLRYAMQISAARNPQQYAGHVQMRRMTSRTYANFYLGIVGTSLAVYAVPPLLLGVVLVMSLFWVPQILLNSFYGVQRALAPRFVLTFTLTRLVLPVYVLAYPANVFEVQPHFSVCAVLVALYVAQVIVLHLQDVLGGRFLVPKPLLMLLPIRYDYHRPFMLDVERSADYSCVVCMSDVAMLPGDYMVTPCNHVFHTDCLRTWMDSKLECPTCRAGLPSPTVRVV